MSLPHIQMLCTAAVDFAVFSFFWAASRLLFDPLRKFPGPRLAALTRWYEFCYDVIKDGIFAKQFPRQHQKYGAILRIGPNHLHVNDPDFYKEVFRNQTSYHKSHYFYRSLRIGDSIISMTDSHQHKAYRTIINPLFSKASLDPFQATVNEIVERAANILRKG